MELIIYPFMSSFLNYLLGTNLMSYRNKPYLFAYQLYLDYSNVFNNFFFFKFKASPWKINNLFVNNNLFEVGPITMNLSFLTTFLKYHQIGSRSYSNKLDNWFFFALAYIWSAKFSTQFIP